MTDTTPTLPAPKIGKFRRARLVKKGYDVRVTDKETGETTWIEVTRDLQIFAPLKVTRLYLANGDEFGLRADVDEVMSRTPGEKARAAAADAKAAS